MTIISNKSDVVSTEWEIEMIEVKRLNYVNRKMKTTFLGIKSTD